MKKVTLSFLLAIGIFQPAIGATNQVVEQTQQITKAQGIWIDVRSPAEFAEGHIEGAINIPVNEIARRISEVTTDKNAPIHLYCRSGNRSGVALNTLKEMGFTHLTNQGGYKDLVAKGIK